MKLLLPLSILATTVSGADNCYVCKSAENAMGTPDAVVVSSSGFFDYSCSELQEELTNSSLSCLGATLYYENLLNAELDVACGCPGANSNGGGSGGSGSNTGGSSSASTMELVSAAAVVGTIVSLMAM